MLAKIRLPMGSRSTRYFAHAKLLAILVAVLGTLVLPASVNAYVYWESGTGIGRADLDGRMLTEGFLSNPAAPAMPTAATGIAIGGKYLYFAESGSHGEVSRASSNPAGISQSLFQIPQPESGEVNARALAVEGRYIYWCTGEAGELSSDAIGRAEIDGANIEPDFIKLGKPVYGLAVNASHIYWVTQHSISRASLDGTVETELIPLIRPVLHTLTASTGYLYWEEGHEIERASIAGTQINRDFISIGPGSVNDVTVSGGYIYWDAEVAALQSPSSAPTEWIGRATLAGREVKPHFIRLASPLAGNIAVDTFGRRAKQRFAHAQRSS